MDKNRGGNGGDRTISMTADSITLEGILNIPQNAKGIVVFAHGAGSSRFSPRNTYVARFLQASGLATLLFDLLTEKEAMDRDLVFDIEFLANRLSKVTVWLQQQSETKNLSIGYFGASTGAAAALVAAAEVQGIRAVVSRGGRPDLAAGYMPKVKAPTLLIVGGEDYPVIALNKEAFQLLGEPKHLEIVPGATHLFEEPGTLEEVARLAKDWFLRYLPRAQRRVA